MGKGYGPKSMVPGAKGMGHEAGMVDGWDGWMEKG
jgi:hypothetical protein